MDSLMTGQLQWDIPSTYVTITPEQLYGSEEITFYIPSFNLASVPEEEHLRVMEDLQMMGQLANLSQVLRSELEPTYN